LPDAPGRYKSESTSELYHSQDVLARGVFLIPLKEDDIMPKAKKLPSGNYRVQAFDYQDSDGKKHYRSFTAPTK
jgi:hypothetical protein